MDLDSLIDFANEANEEIAKYTVPVTLSPEKMMVNEHAIETLTWESISYGGEELERVPADKRGIYAFAVCRHSDVLPPHGYVLYIGIAGREGADIHVERCVIRRNSWDGIALYRGAMKDAPSPWNATWLR